VLLDQLQQKVDVLRKKEIPMTRVERVNEKNERICIAQGYEMSQELTTEVNGQAQTWTERRLLIQSTSAAEAAERSLQERVKKAEQAIKNLLIRKQGKQHLKTSTEIDEAIQEIWKNFVLKVF